MQTNRRNEIKVARTAAPRLHRLTGLRAVVAGLVFLFHLRTFVAPDAFGWTAPLADQGAAGVGAFFVLSGFVMAWAGSADSVETGEFIRRRMARIAPAYLVVLLVAIVIRAGLGELSPAGTVASLVLMQSWAPSPDIHFAVEPVFWSLSCEFAFYLAFPSLVHRVSGLSQGALMAGMAMCVAAMAGVAAAAGDLAGVSFWVVYVFPLVRMLEFSIGVMAGLVASRHLAAGGSIPRFALPVAGTLCTVTYLSASFVPEVARPTLLLVVPWTLLIAAMALTPGEGFLGSPVPRKLGEWSYGFYLLHTIVITVVAKALSIAGIDLFGEMTPVMMTAVVIITLGLSIIASAALHRMVEVPGRDLILARRSDGPPGPAPGAPAPLAKAGRS